MPDRTKAPAFKEIDRLSLPEPHKVILRNGMPMYVIAMGHQEVSKLEVVFRAGRPFEHKQLVARATNALLKEGTAKYTGAYIAEEMDFYGCSLNTPFNIDVSTVTVYIVNRHLDRVLPLLADMLSAPAFPQKELEAFIRRNQQRLQVDLSKSDVLAYRKITELVFGKHHPYGYNSFPETYRQLRQEDLLRHFHRLHNSGNGMVFFSGKVTQAMIEQVDVALSAAIPKGVGVDPVLPEIKAVPEHMSVQHEGSMQTAVRLGRRLFNRYHPDYPAFYVLNMILGGYFGSRLMANIREQQGFTYNIYSMLDPMVYDGGFYIGTEVGNEVVEETLKQIYLELDRLRNDLVSQEELEMVKNYTLGYLLTLIDGTFSVGEVIKTLYVDGLSVSFLNRLAGVIRSVRAEELRTLAQRYLKPEDLWEVVTGPNV